MEQNYKIFCGESNGHGVRYVTFHFFGAKEDEIMKALNEVLPGYYYSNGYIYEEDNYACVDVSKAVTSHAKALSKKLPGVRVYAENSWTEVESVTMCAYLDGKIFKDYMIAKPEDLEDDPVSKFGEYDEYNELYYGILTIIDITTGSRIEFGCSGIEAEEIEELKVIISKHPYDKNKDKRRDTNES